jgi:hypothetical protein
MAERGKDENGDEARDQAAHTELRPAGAGRRDRPGKDGEGASTLKPRSRTLPDALKDDPDEDDPFNDVPV